MRTLEEYIQARDRAEGARKHMAAVGERFVELGRKLQAPGGARINEPTTLIGGGGDYSYLIGKDDVPEWAQAEDAIRKFVEADQWLRRVEGELTPDQWRQIRQLQGR